jgi:hypothetical protein
LVSIPSQVGTLFGLERVCMVEYKMPVSIPSQRERLRLRFS